MTKPTIWPVRPAKTDSDQPGFHPVWSESAVCRKKPWVLSYPLSTQWRLIRLGGYPGFPGCTGNIVGFVKLWLICWWFKFLTAEEQAIYHYMGRVKRIWYLTPMRAAKVQASLCIRAVSPEPPLLAHTSSDSSGTFRQKARFPAPLNGWACAVKICHDGMLEDTNSLDAPHIMNDLFLQLMNTFKYILNGLTCLF